MLNYDTLLSSYDDKLTLMQWLKKVEEALEHASATAFHVNKTGNATLTFSIDFDDGTELESEEITLQQGESVASAAINNGVLTLTLTNGDVLTAGNIFNGNLTLNGDLNVNGDVSAVDVSASGDITATGDVTANGVNATGTGVKTSTIGNNGGNIDVFAPVISFNGNVEAQGNLQSDSDVVADYLDASTANEISARKPVVEVMAGYSYANIVSAKIEKSVSYAGVVKNGNKLTFAYALKVKVIDTIDALVNLCDFTLPLSVLNNLIPSSLGGYSSVLDFKQIPFYQYATTASMVTAQIFKTGNGIRLSFYPSSLAQNIEYYGRIEVTFLLSENLAA